MHERKRVFKCKECDREFGKYNHLKKHIQNIHLKLKPFSCELCDYASSSKDRLISHVTLKHNKGNIYLQFHKKKFILLYLIFNILFIIN